MPTSFSYTHSRHLGGPRCNLRYTTATYLLWLNLYTRRFWLNNILKCICTIISKNSTGIITTTVHKTERKRTECSIIIIRTITFYIDSNCVLSCILITTEIFSAMFEGNSEKTKAPITISN